MEFVSIGLLIKNERLKKGISQEELAYGICTTTTLSRLERGIHCPNRKNINALLERLGKPDIIMEYSGDSDEERSLDIRERLTENIINNKYDDYRSLLREYISLKSKLASNQDEQFIKWTELSYKIYQGEFAPEIYRQIREAIRSTIKDYDEKKEIRFMLTTTEAELVRLLAYFYYKTDNVGMALHIVENTIKLYLESEVDIIFTGGICSQFMYDKAAYLMALKEYEKAYSAICERKELCLKSARYDQLLKCSELKVECEIKLNMENEAKETLVESYHALKAIGEDEQAEKLRKLAKNRYGIIFKIEYE